MIGWLVDATRTWSDGQFYTAAFLAVTGIAMAADLACRHITRPGRRHSRRGPTRPAGPYDWACNDIRLRQACNVHRKAS